LKPINDAITELQRTISKIVRIKGTLTISLNIQ